MKAEKNILIIGAGIGGRLLQRDIENGYRSYRIIGFLDDNVKPGRLNVLGKIKDCPKIIHRHTVDEIVIAIPSADGSLVRKVLLNNLYNRIPIKIVPRSQRVIGEWDVRYEEIKHNTPEDFLGRPFTQQNVDRLRNFYRNKVVFVTGGAGSIGSEIVVQLLDLKVKKVIVYDNSEYLLFMLDQRLSEMGQRKRCELVIGSILNERKVDDLLRKLKPDIIFHAAAYKHVPLMHENPDESISVNLIGTKRVVDAAIRNKIKSFTYVSTDKAVNPTSVMGATKKLSEYYIKSVKKTKTKFHIVRFGNVINSTGSVLPLFERQIELHGYVAVTHKKMKRFFMSIREAAQLVIESTALNKENAVHLLNMGELIDIYEIALCLLSAKGLIPHIDVEIRVTGLRKGEKLAEELYTESERKNLLRTKDNRFFSLEYDENSPFDIQAVIAELEEAVAQNGDQDILLGKLKGLFPSLILKTSQPPKIYNSKRGGRKNYRSPRGPSQLKRPTNRVDASKRHRSASVRG